jgi:hypothetical protein
MLVLVYNVDPLLRPKSLGVIKIISFMEDKDVIEKTTAASWPAEYPKP